MTHITKEALLQVMPLYITAEQMRGILARAAEFSPQIPNDTANRLRRIADGLEDVANNVTIKEFRKLMQEDIALLRHLAELSAQDASPKDVTTTGPSREAVESLMLEISNCPIGSLAQRGEVMLRALLAKVERVDQLRAEVERLRGELVSEVDAHGKTVMQLANAINWLPCWHPASLLLRSAETGEPLYCELCDDKSGRRDAEKIEAELRATVAEQGAVGQKFADAVQDLACIGDLVLHGLKHRTPINPYAKKICDTLVEQGAALAELGNRLARRSDTANAYKTEIVHLRSELKVAENIPAWAWRQAINRYGVNAEDVEFRARALAAEGLTKEG